MPINNNVQCLNAYDRSDAIPVEFLGGLSNPTDLQLAAHCLAFELLRSWTATGLAAYNNERRAIADVEPLTPIKIVAAGPHGLSNGATVVVAGVTGIVGANGTWVITVVNSTTFTLNGSVGIGVYTGGGEWHSPGPVYEDVAPGLLDESLARIALNPATAERAMILTESDRSVCQQYGENYFEHGYVAILAGVDPNAKRTFHRDSGISTN